MGVGVDRMDYTKGILERFLAVERCSGKVSALPGCLYFCADWCSQSHHIKTLSRLAGRTGGGSRPRINWRFQANQWKPIVLLNRQHSHKEIQPYYRAADLCLVTSLHDGMNLVAKEIRCYQRGRARGAYPELFYRCGA